MDKIQGKLLFGAVVALLSIGLAFNIYVPQDVKGVLLGIGMISLAVTFIATVRLM